MSRRGVPGRSAGAMEPLEVLDRVLDRGIVIDAEFRVNVVGLTLAGIECRIVVAGIETYLEYADDLSRSAPASWRSVRAEDAPAAVLSFRDHSVPTRLKVVPDEDQGGVEA